MKQPMMNLREIMQLSLKASIEENGTRINKMQRM